MKAAVLLATVVLSFVAPASAEPRSNTRYCIEMADSGGSAGPPQCMFETLAQCIASKTAPSDRCMLNPAFDARARNIR